MTRSLKWMAYGLVRPVLRPVMHRLRLFFVGRLNDEIRELRGEIAVLRTLLEARQPEVVEAVVNRRARQIMAEALATLALDREGRDQASDDLPFST